MLLTDGRANIARDGTPGRARAEEEALAAGRRARGRACAPCSSTRHPARSRSRRGSQPRWAALYLPLPHADAATLSRAVQTAAATR